MDNVDIVLSGVFVVLLVLAFGWWYVVRPMARRRALKFVSLAHAYQCTVESKDEFERFFALNVHNRDFRVAEFYSRGRGAEKIVPMDASGYYLMTSTALESKAWQSHGINLRQGEWRRPAGSNMTQKRSGDAGFDRAFAVSELGDVLPEHWLNRELRGLVRSFFALPMGPSALNVEAGVLTQYVPWRGDGMTPRALAEMLRQLGWLASALDRAATGRFGDASDASASAEPVEESVSTQTSDATSHGILKYELSRNTLSFGGSYTFTDPSGAKVYSIVGKPRVLSVAFSLYDAQKNVLFTGSEHVGSLAQKFEISRDGMVFATMQREMLSGHRKIFGTPAYRYDVTLATGDKFQAFAPHGAYTLHWKLRRRDETVAEVHTDGDVTEISLASGTRDIPFVLTVIMAIVRLNPSSRHGSTDS